VSPSSVGESLRTLLDSFPGVVWTTDAELRWTAIFGSDLARLGFAAEDVLGRTLPDFLGTDPMTEPAIEAHVRALAGETASYENVFGGQLRQGYVQPLRSETGEIIGTVGMSVNATGSQLATRQSEARTRAVINAALDAVVIIDSSGALLEFNPAAEAIFGYARWDVIGEQMVDLIIPPSLRDTHREGFARHLRTGESRILGRRLELSAVRADGTEFPVELTITRVRLGDDAVFAGYIRDISGNACSKGSSASHRRWRRSAVSPAASRTTSTTS
jgi:PAS domain S-box-containing protein